MHSVGSLFKKEREKRGLSLKQVEKDIKVREKFLRDVENDSWGSFSSKIYIKGIIRNYSRYLHLDPDKMIAYFRRDYEKKEDIHFKRRVESKYFKSESKYYVVAAISCVVLVFVAYFVYQLSIYLKPPLLEIVSPQERIFYSRQKVTVVGKTEPDATVTIFGDRIFQNKEGVFEYDFPLNEGNNTLVVEVTGANGKITTLSENFRLER